MSGVPDSPGWVVIHDGAVLAALLQRYRRCRVLYVISRGEEA